MVTIHQKQRKNAANAIPSVQMIEIFHLRMKPTEIRFDFIFCSLPFPGEGWGKAIGKRNEKGKPEPSRRA